jgi:hypothetical protein
MYKPLRGRESAQLTGPSPRISGGANGGGSNRPFEAISHTGGALRGSAALCGGSVPVAGCAKPTFQALHSYLLALTFGEDLATW